MNDSLEVDLSHFHRSHPRTNGIQKKPIPLASPSWVHAVQFLASLISDPAAFNRIIQDGMHFQTCPFA